jgi:predicted short-subunit dehydrogenase-like oxidoreductase (DUF2520 family)
MPIGPAQGRDFVERRAAVILPTMKSGKARSPRIAIMGTGKLGTALAVSLRSAGYSITEIVSRAGKSSRQRAAALSRRVGARASILGENSLDAELVWLCVPDGAISSCAKLMAKLRVEGKVVLHSSGALTSDELNVLRKRGARVASVHPMMTFVTGETPALQGVGFAMEGDREAVRVAKTIIAWLGGESFLIAKKDKALYHAWGTFASPLLTALLASSEEVAGAAGISRAMARRWMSPIVRQTIENYAKQGAARGFSGPIIRGDAATIKKHLQVLRRLPVARDVYLVLAQAAIEYLPSKNKSALQYLIKRALRK